VLHRLPILLKIVVLHGLLVAGTMEQQKVVLHGLLVTGTKEQQKARMELLYAVYSQDFLLKSGANW